MGERRSLIRYSGVKGRISARAKTMRPVRQLGAVLLLVLFLVPVRTVAAERRCGWLENPTPGNFSLRDRGGEWVLGVQGGYEAEGFDRMPDMTASGLGGNQWPPRLRLRLPDRGNGREAAAGHAHPFGAAGAARPVPGRPTSAQAVAGRPRGSLPGAVTVSDARHRTRPRARHRHGVSAAGRRAPAPRRWVRGWG